MNSRLAIVVFVLIPLTALGLVVTIWSAWNRVRVGATLPLLRQAVAELKEREPELRRQLDQVPDDEYKALSKKIHAIEFDTRDTLETIKPFTKQAGQMAPRLKALEESIRQLRFQQEQVERKSKAFAVNVASLEQSPTKLSAAEIERRALAGFAVRSAHLHVREEQRDEARGILVTVPADLRFWDWRYVSGLIDGRQTATEVRFEFDCDDAVAAPDGKELLIAGQGKVHRLSDRPDAVAEAILTDRGSIKAMAVHAATRRLGLFCETELGLFVELWDLAKNQQISRTDVPDWNGPARLLFPDRGDRISLCGPDDPGRIWKLPKLEVSGDLGDPRKKDSDIRRFTLDDSGKFWLVERKTGFHVLVPDLGRAGVSKRVSRVTDERVEQLAVAPNGTQCLWATGQGRLHLFDEIESGAVGNRAVLVGAKHSIAFFRDTRRFAVLAFGGTLEIRDFSRHVTYSTLIVAPKAEPPHSLALLDNERTIAVVFPRRAVFYRIDAPELQK